MVENESDIEDSEYEECVLSGDEPGVNKWHWLEFIRHGITVTFEQVYVSHCVN